MSETKSFEIRKTVPFYDLDPMQIVWHGNYFNYFEDARRELLEHLGIDLYKYFEKTKTIFPIIRTSTSISIPSGTGMNLSARLRLSTPASSSWWILRSGWPLMIKYAPGAKRSRSPF